MLALVGRDSLVGLPIDHVIVLYAVASHPEQNNQPCYTRKFLAKPPRKIFDAACADVNLIR